MLPYPGGGLLRVINDERDIQEQGHALTITTNAAHSVEKILFTVPRNNDILSIGGVAEPYQSQ